MTLLRIAVNSPLRRLFDYLPPPDLGPAELDALRPGVRLRVPFGRREVTGWLQATLAHSEQPADSLREALALLDPEPLLPPSMLALCHWAADYYQHPPGEVLAAAFPRRLRMGEARQSQGEPGWRLSRRGRGLPAGALARSPRQAEALALLQQGPTGAAALRAAGISAAVMRELHHKGLAERCTLPSAVTGAHCGAALALNPDQAAAVEAVKRAGEGFSSHLLEGVTGSGKTEVYLQLIADCVRRGRQALVLIPEIGLTPQTLARFRQRFEAEIAVFHSGLGDAERYRAWEAARDGRAHIVIGTRSAVFTPLARPGLIIVDEEHDTSYKQQDGFRYSARDVAVKRAQLEAVPVLLGSATPSLESLHNALSGRYGHHRLKRRAGGAALPAMEVVDVRSQPLQAGLSPALLAAVDEAIRRGEQVLLFLNRRGYAPSLQCHDCGWLGECDHCDARLTVHRRQGRLRCHHCGAARPLPRECPRCHGSQLLACGLGTEQAEETLRQRYRDTAVYRVDSDTMQGRHAMSALLETLAQGAPAVLLGPEMLSEGHHFPGVSLVAVVDADALLFSADFRGEERMAQLLTQVAGRAGRESLPGRVLLQSHHPDHPLLQSLLQQDYATVARALLDARRAAGLPPAGHLVLLRTDCGDAAEGEQFLQQLKHRLQPGLGSDCRQIGPLPAPLQRRAGRFRYQLVISAPSRAGARRAAAGAVAVAEALKTRRGLNWTIDVDPQEM